MHDIYDVVGIGNAIVDVLTFTEEDFLSEHGLIKGSMMLIDEEQAESLYSAMDAATECSGGSAANTMAGIASLGGEVSFIGKVKLDQLGEIFRHDMHAIGVHFDTPPMEKGPATARCLILVTPDAQRTMNTYLGACVEVTPADINEALIAHSKVTYVEGYLWDKPNAKDAVRRALEIAKSRNKKIAFSLSDTFCVERHREEFLDLIENHLDIVFANENEIKALYQTKDFEDAVSKIRGKCDVAALTRSEKGAVIVTPDAVVRIDGEKVSEVVDTTGAGDLFAAGFLYGYTQGWSVLESGQLGNRCAAHIITQLGARSAKPLHALLAA